jgi:hypothetical protein
MPIVQFEDALNTTLEAEEAPLPANLRDASGLDDGALSNLVTATAPASRAIVSDANGKLAASSVTSTEVGYLSGVSSAIQTQIDGKEPTITAGTSSQLLQGDKALVNKVDLPIGTATQAALDEKQGLEDWTERTFYASALGIETTLQNVSPADVSPILDDVVSATPADGTSIIVFDAAGFVNVGTVMADVPSNKTIVIRCGSGIQFSGTQGASGLKFTRLEYYDQPALITGARSAWRKSFRGHYRDNSVLTTFGDRSYGNVHALLDNPGDTTNAQGTETTLTATAFVPDLSEEWPEGEDNTKFCQKSALAGAIVTESGDSAQCVGVWGYGEIQTPTTLESGATGRGITWGGNFNAKVASGSDGNAYGAEFNVTNCGLTAPTEPDGSNYAKVGATVIPGQGATGHATAAYTVLPTDVAFYQVLYSPANALVNNAASRFLNYKGKFEVTYDGSLILGASASSTAKFFVDNASNGQISIGADSTKRSVISGGGLANGAYNTQTQADDGGIFYKTAFNIRPQSAGSEGVRFNSSGAIMFGDYVPGATDTYELGKSYSSWKNLYVQNSPVVTSDRDTKTDFKAIDDAILDAWAEARKGVLLYRKKSSVQERGSAARHHVGFIAQDIVKAFEDKGLDPFELGIICKLPQIERVTRTRTVSRPVIETVKSTRPEVQVIDGKHTLVEVEAEVQRQAVRSVPLHDKDGNPLLLRRQGHEVQFLRNDNGTLKLDEMGNPVAVKVLLPSEPEPMMHEELLFEDVEEIYEEDVETGEYRLALRYDECFCLEIALNERRLGRQKAG